MALHNFHGAHEEFPPGGITPGPCCNTKSFESWTISILPFIEEQTLHDQYDFTAHNEDPENEFVRQAIVPTYMCPSEPQVDSLDKPESGPGNNLLYRRGSYRCMAGRVLGPENYWDRDNTLPRHWRGVMHVVGVSNLKAEKIKNITDGTSKTLAVGEMATVTHERRRTFWLIRTWGITRPWQRRRAARCWSTMIAASKSVVQVDRTLANEVGADSTRAFCLFALCDGSVRNVNITIDMNVFTAIATIAGEEVAQVP